MEFSWTQQELKSSSQLPRLKRRTQYTLINLQQLQKCFHGAECKCLCTMQLSYNCLGLFGLLIVHNPIQHFPCGPWWSYQQMSATRDAIRGQQGDKMLSNQEHWIWGSPEALLWDKLWWSVLLVAQTSLLPNFFTKQCFSVQFYFYFDICHFYYFKTGLDVGLTKNKKTRNMKIWLS